MPLGYTITEYELPTPSGSEDYSCWDLKSKIWESRPDLSHFQWISHCKWFRTLDTPQKFRLQISAAIIFDPRGSWKLIFGDCVAQGHCLKSWEPIFVFSIFSPKFFDFWKSASWKTRNSGFALIFRTKFSFKSSQKCNFRYFGVSNNPGYHCRCVLERILNNNIK